MVSWMKYYVVLVVNWKTCLSWRHECAIELVFIAT